MQRYIIHRIPALDDNYLFLIEDTKTSKGLAVDPGDAAPILDVCETRSLSLETILLTHHHADHIGGVKSLRATFNPRVIGATSDQHRLPALDQTVSNDAIVSWSGLDFQVIEAPGHTSGHVVYLCRTLNAAFVGDVIFGFGCGRVFEGTYQQMYDSLQRVKELLPGDCKLYCAHEYTRKNAEFVHAKARHLTESMARAIELLNGPKDKITVPLDFAEELKTNPFLLAANLAEFSELRNARNTF